MSPLVIGFVERHGSSPAGPALQLPFAIPVVHIALGSGPGPNIVFSAGSDTARDAGPGTGRSTFVIALSCSGADLLLPDTVCASFGGFLPLEDKFWPSLHVQLSEARTFKERVRIAERHLMPVIRRRKVSPSQLLQAADAVIQDRWTGSVKALGSAVGLEERTLRNRFNRELGWSPKGLLRVARFNRLLRTLHPRPWAGTPAWDARLEFTDDSHVYREFLHFAGFAPSAFVRAKRRSGDSLLHNVTIASLEGSARPEFSASTHPSTACEPA